MTVLLRSIAFLAVGGAALGGCVGSGEVPSSPGASATSDGAAAPGPPDQGAGGALPDRAPGSGGGADAASQPEGEASPLSDDAAGGLDAALSLDGSPHEVGPGDSAGDAGAASEAGSDAGLGSDVGSASDGASKDASFGSDATTFAVGPLPFDGGVTPSGTLVVDPAVSTGPIRYGGIGWLYGLGENTKPADAMITGLVHPQFTNQKAPGGLQHPDGDALKVAPQFKRIGGKGVGVYMQDYYAQWPYPTTSVSAYMSGVVDKVASAVVADPNRKYMHYVPFNEPDWIWYAPSGPTFTAFLSDWKTVYARLRSDDPGAVIAGPNFSHYDATAYDTFFAFAKNNNCVPDITTWHELRDDFRTNYRDNYANYRSIEARHGIATREVFINEYGRQTGDLGRPGRLIQFLARFEDTKVYGGLAFWTGIGTLNDLVASDGTATGAWYLYQWYGQETGNTVKVQTPDRNGYLQAMAFTDATRPGRVDVIFGGSANDTDVFGLRIIITGLTASSVAYQLSETNYSGTNHAPPPAVIASGTATVTDGQAAVPVTGCKALSAYLLNVGP